MHMPMLQRRSVVPIRWHAGACARTLLSISLAAGLGGCDLVPTASSGQSISDGTRVVQASHSLVLRAPRMTIVNNGVETPLASQQLALTTTSDLNGLRFYPGTKISKITVVRSEDKGNAASTGQNPDDAPNPDDAVANVQSIAIDFLSPARPVAISRWMADALPEGQRFFVATLAPTQLTGGITGGGAFSISFSDGPNGQTRGVMAIYNP